MNDNHDERGRFAAALSVAHAKLDKLAVQAGQQMRAMMRDQSGASTHSADQIMGQVHRGMHRFGLDDPATLGELPATRLAGHLVRHMF